MKNVGLPGRENPELAAFVESHLRQVREGWGTHRVAYADAVKSLGHASGEMLSSRRSWNPTLHNVREGWGTRRRWGRLPFVVSLLQPARELSPANLLDEPNQQSDRQSGRRSQV